MTTGIDGLTSGLAESTGAIDCGQSIDCTGEIRPLSFLTAPGDPRSENLPAEPLEACWPWGYAGSAPWLALG